MKIDKQLQYLVLVILISTFNIGCQSDFDVERRFKNSARKLNKIMYKVQKNIEVTVEKEKENIFLVRSESENAENYISKKQEALANIEEELNKVTSSEPLSIWSDDAAFILCIEYLIFSSIDKEYLKKSIQAIEEFLIDYSNCSIEKWTKHLLSNVFWDNFEKALKIGFSPEIPKGEQIRGQLRVFLSLQKIHMGEHEAAIEGLHKIILEYPKTGIAKYAEGQIETIRTLSGKNGDGKENKINDDTR